MAAATPALNFRCLISTGVPFDLDANHGKIKFILENGKWIYQESVFGVEYDEWWKRDDNLNRDVATASVYVNGTALANREMMPFNVNEELVVNYEMPEERAGCEPLIVIESNEWWYATWGEGANELKVSGNSFTITPPNGDVFWIRFWWSDYDYFELAEDEFLIETSGEGGNVSPNLTNVTVVNTKNEPNDYGGKRTVVKRDTLKNDSVTFTFTPEENRRLCNVDIWMDNQNESYSLRTNNEDYNVGDIITCGKYEQDSNFENGPEDIEWQVLSVEDERVLVISKYGLEDCAYNTENKDITWENCSLRNWLNNDFYNTSFNDQEKQKILSVTLANKDNPVDGTEGGNDTIDKVFCLSLEEMEKYFGEYSYYDSELNRGYNQNLICAPSLDLIERGHTYEITENGYSNNYWGYKTYGYTSDVIGKKGCIWWLRTPGQDSAHACDVGWDGVAGAHCDYSVWLGGNVVRPAMYINVNNSNRKPINVENGFSEADGVYTFTYDLSEYENNRINIHAFFEDTQNNWIKENKYFVEYDSREYYDEENQEQVYNAFVKKDGKTVKRYDDRDDSTLYDYTIGDTYTFSLKGPKERKGCTPIVYVETGLGEFYSTDANRTDESHRLELNEDNSFSFTPKDKYGFMIRVHWSDYDCLGPEGEEEFLVETNGDNGTVTADLSKLNIIRSMEEPNDGAGKKYIIDRSELETKLKNKITFTFTPNKNSRLSGVDFWLDRREDEKRFTLRKDDADPNKERINEKNGFKEENGVYTYTFDLSGCDTRHIGASAWFENTQDLSIAENEYRVRYNEFGGPEDELPGRVFVNGVYVSSCDDDDERLNYTVKEKINFALELPANRTGCTPIVEIKTETGEYYSSKKGSVDSKHLLTLNSDNTFSFTPEDKYGFDIWINWSDFDSFWYDNHEEFLVMADYYFNGSVSVDKEPKGSFDGGREDIGVKYLYDNSALESEDIRVKMTPDEGFYVASVWLRIDRPGQDYFEAFYVSGEPGGEDRDMFEDGSGFSKEDDVVYYTIPKDVAGAFVIMSVEYRENHDDLKIYGKGRKVEYCVDDAGAYTVLPDGSDTIPKEVFENADEIHFRFSDLDENVRGVRVIITDYYQYTWLDPLESDGTYTIRKADIGGKWKGIEVELIDWKTPLDGQYMIQWFGAEDDMDSANGLEKDEIYFMPASGSITLKFNEPVYKVVAEPDWGERVDVRAADNNNKVFRYTPENNDALIIKVFPTQDEYEYYEEIYPDHNKNQFSAEFDVNNNLDKPGIGGEVTYNVEPVYVGKLVEEVKEWNFMRNKNKLILNEGTKKITLTITPNIGCDYDILVRDQDVTDQVKKNGNKYVWDVSDPMNIPWICVGFFAGDTPLSGKVTISGTEKYGETLTATVTGEVNQEAVQYQWKRDGVAIKGATEATYTTEEADVRKIISCEVTSALQSGSLLGKTSGKIARADGPEEPTGLSGVDTTRAGKADGKIKGTSVLMEYATKTDFSDGKSCNGTEVTGLKAGTYYVRMKESPTHEPGKYATVIVNDSPVYKPAAPSNVKSVACTKKGEADGRITGVSALMEYSTKSDFATKKKCYSNEILGLKAGKYYVRIAATETSEASDSVEVTVEDGQEEVPKTQDELVGDFVERFYTQILGRDSEEAGLQNWKTALEAGTRGGADVAFEFIKSPEFQLKNETDEQYITRLYHAFFNREPDEAGMESWLKDLENGKDRDFILNGFLVSEEYRALCEKYGIKRDSTRTFVRRFYKIILGRTDD